MPSLPAQKSANSSTPPRSSITPSALPAAWLAASFIPLKNAVLPFVQNGGCPGTSVRIKYKLIMLAIAQTVQKKKKPIV